MTARSPGSLYLAVYSACATSMLGILLLGAARRAPTTFDEITVHRINVVEPDGTIRLVLSDHARLPGLIVHGHETTLARPQAGMLFYNDEGSEVGGLIFGGRTNTRGQVENAGGSLSFDRYGANQEVQLMGVHDNEDRVAGLIVRDSPPDSAGHRRVWLGRDETGAAAVTLMDAAGRDRVRIEAPAKGAPRILLLDTTGKVVRRIDPETR